MVRTAVPDAAEMLSTESLQVLVVDGQALSQAAMRELLAGPPLCAEVRSCHRSDRALEWAVTERFDLIFCDVGAQPLSGAQLAVKLGASGNPAVMVLLGDAGDETLLMSKLDCGARGFFTKDGSLEEFIDGIEAIRRGHFVICERLAEPALELLTNATRPRDGMSQLSPAEKHILACIGRAESVATIASSQGISQKTVRNHVASIYRKLELRSRTEAILCAARMGIGADPAF